MIDISGPFIRRPVGTILLAVGLFLAGMVAYFQLPVASLPSVDFPTIRVSANRPGADPETMAASVAAPLERHLGTIAGGSEITSYSLLGATSITVQFDPSRKIDGAARDVQAAINAAASDLPSDLTTAPSLRKFNPAGMPVLILALTSETLSVAEIYDIADTVIVQRLSQVEGVADVTVTGGEQPAIRVRADPARLAAANIGLDDLRKAIANANVRGALGQIQGDEIVETISADDRLARPEDYEQIVVKAVGGAIVRVKDVATVVSGVRNTRAAGWYNDRPAVILNLTKQADANVIDTVDRVRALIPELKRWVPAELKFSVVNDRTVTIRAGVTDTRNTLFVAIALVMMVVIAFLGRLTPTIAAGITVPLSLAGTFAAMWVVGFSIDNLSLMALTIAVGFVVDDAIVMIENIHRQRVAGATPLAAALAGARQIAFTVVAIGLSLIAAFIPLMFTSGMIGKFFAEFSFTMTFAILVSTVVSLTVTPMICGRFIRGGPPTRAEAATDRAVTKVAKLYGRSLGFTLAHPWSMAVLASATVAATVWLYMVVPKGMLPQDDTSLVFGYAEAAPDVSFPAMVELQKRAIAIVLADPMVKGVASSVGSGMGAVNNGRMFLSLKTVKEGGEPSRTVITRLRKSLTAVPGIRIYMSPMQDLHVGGRIGKSPYQFTLWDPEFGELVAWTPKVVEALKKLPEIVDVSSDRMTAGLQAEVVIDRMAASRLGVGIRDIDAALANAYAQRLISVIHSPRNQYRVVLEVEGRHARDPSDIEGLWVNASGGRQGPLAAVARIERKTAPLAVNHQGQFPAVTVTFDVAPGVTLEEAIGKVRGAVDELHPPDTLHTEFAGDAKEFSKSAGNTWILVATALFAVYVILGVLYESLIHPLTIISTLPPAGLGALIALQAFGMQLDLVGIIGIILLIGIVKKNGILLVDFALMAGRDQGLSTVEAVRTAAVERFRPILMTTLAALLGALPLVLASGAGAEMRRPLGVTIVGGLVVSQVLTLYTTPAIYLLMDRLAAWVRRRRGIAETPGAAVAAE